jgi:DNA-binding response OmpR family regulator
MKILLIEDSKFQRLAMERALVKAGYGVLQRETARKGWLWLARTLPTLFCSI